MVFFNWGNIGLEHCTWFRGIGSYVFRCIFPYRTHHQGIHSPTVYWLSFHFTLHPHSSSGSLNSEVKFLEFVLVWFCLFLCLVFFLNFFCIIFVQYEYSPIVFPLPYHLWINIVPCVLPFSLDRDTPFLYIWNVQVSLQVLFFPSSPGLFPYNSTYMWNHMILTFFLVTYFT